ncbi:hypothetical protein Sjap_016842 [Stephania japonica]|uniref:Hexosyltransferase n=1 Tax=Stephania japonica TaxID=461633 RepID=A0AAP0I518_9MAGN
MLPGRSPRGNDVGLGIPPWVDGRHPLRRPTLVVPRKHPLPLHHPRRRHRHRCAARRSLPLLPLPPPPELPLPLRPLRVRADLHLHPHGAGLPTQLRPQLPPPPPPHLPPPRRLPRLRPPPRRRHRLPLLHPLGPHPDTVLAAPEHCNANFTSYFTPTFWSNPTLSLTFTNARARPPCYFNTGVMLIHLHRWRRRDYTKRIEEWMELQKRMRIYELGSLPPFLLVFAGNIAPVDHRWNQHGLGGDNFRGLCRDLHPGPVSLLHWSGKGKPWARLDANRPCPLDALWAPYDLLETQSTALDQ